MNQVENKVRRFNKSQNVWELVGMASMYEPLRSSGVTIADLVMDDPRLTQAMKSVELALSYPDRFLLIRYNDENDRTLIAIEETPGDDHFMYKVLSHALTQSTILHDVEENFAYILPQLGKRRQDGWQDMYDRLQETHRVMVTYFAPKIEDPRTSDSMIYAYPDPDAPANSRMIVRWSMLNQKEVYFFDNEQGNTFNRSVTIDPTEYGYLRRLSRSEMAADPDYLTKENRDFVLFRLRQLALNAAGVALRKGNEATLIVVPPQ
jgi:hypothetical protein